MLSTLRSKEFSATVFLLHYLLWPYRSRTSCIPPFCLNLSSSHPIVQGIGSCSGPHNLPCINHNRDICPILAPMQLVCQHVPLIPGWVAQSAGRFESAASELWCWVPARGSGFAQHWSASWLGCSPGAAVNRDYQGLCSVGLCSPGENITAASALMGQAEQGACSLSPELDKGHTWGGH